MITTMITIGGYNRSRGLEVTRRYREPFDWILQWYWTNGCGGRKYDPALPGHTYKTRKEAEAAKRAILHPTAQPGGGRG